MPSTLSGAEKATYEAIFRHPVAHNLEWRSLIAVFNHIGELEEEANGKMKFSRNGHSLTFHREGKDVGVDEIIHIRHFLESSRSPAAPNPASTRDTLVVMDHSGARIFSADSEGHAPEHVIPFDPTGHDHQVHNSRNEASGKQGPMRKQFYEDVAKKLEGADRILLIGNGQGGSSEMERFVAELQQHHQGLAERIASTEVADIGHMTDGDFVAKAKSFFSAAAGELR